MDKRNDKGFEMEAEALLQTLQQDVTTAEFESKKKALMQRVAYLILHDFDRLLRLLYTVDVDERVLKHLLQQQPQPDAATVITELLIQRQLKKLQTRQQFNTGTKPPEEEAW